MLALLTGATRGIGAAVCRKLLKMGYTTAFLYRNEHTYRAFLGTLSEEEQSRVWALQGNLAKPDDITAFSERLLAEKGLPETIILNAGVYEGGFPSELSPAEWATQLQLNFGQVQQTLFPLLPALKVRKSGKIILIGTVVTREPRTFAASYTLSKGLLDQYGRLLADELRGFNIDLTRILPGSVNTETWGDADVPRECFVEPDDIAGTVEFVLNQRAPVWIEEIVVRPLDKNW